jgi:hypothetical protein
MTGAHEWEYNFAGELEFEASELNFIFEEPETGATKGSQNLSNV